MNSYFLSVFKHNHQTRFTTQRGSMLPEVKTSMIQKTVTYRTMSRWNSLPEHENTKVWFKLSLKQYLQYLQQELQLNCAFTLVTTCLGKKKETLVKIEFIIILLLLLFLLLSFLLLPTISIHFSVFFYNLFFYIDLCLWPKFNQCSFNRYVDLSETDSD